MAALRRKAAMEMLRRGTPLFAKIGSAAKGF
jgi:hypothetical protein